MFHLQSDKPETTLKYGEKFSRLLRGGETIALSGELGAGKTVFVKGMASGLGVKEIITSPTFVLVKSYAGKYNLHHMDFYRLDVADELETIGFEDYFGPENIVAVEWAEKFPDQMPQPHWKINITYSLDSLRKITAEFTGEKSREEQMRKNFVLPAS